MVLEFAEQIPRGGYFGTTEIGLFEVIARILEQRPYWKSAIQLTPFCSKEFFCAYFRG
jgi:hypothetical protein